MARSFPTLSLILSLLSAPIFLSAQNIVPNGKLDSVNICTEYKAPCCPAGWFFTARPRSGGVYGKPAHVLQFITARNDKSTRQYWQTYLLCPLQPGTKYRIRIKVASNYIGPNLHDLGLYFTDHFIYSQGDTLMQPDYYIGFMDAKYTELKAYWFQLEKTFTALERKQVLIIGNFSSESNRHITRQRHLDKADLMVTDIEITPTEGGLCPGWQQVQDSLYAIHNRHSDPTHPAPPRDEQQDTIKTEKTIKTIDTLHIPDIDFAFDSYRLTDSTVLDPNRSLLESKTIDHILVAGYTDDKGTEAYNLNLSQQRAAEVAHLLTNRYGIDAAIITIEGRGISHTYKNDAANRRVEIYIYH